VNEVQKTRTEQGTGAAPSGRMGFARR